MAERAADDSSKSTSPFLVALVALAVLFVIAFLPRAVAGRHELVGKPAPDFTLDVVHNGEPGARMTLSALQGKPVLLDFWATWCGPCQVEAPILSRVADRYKDRGLVVVGVNTNDRAGLAAGFAAKKKLSYPIVFDEKSSTGDAFHVSSLPTLVLVGKDGTVRAVRTGLVDEGTIDALVGAELLVPAEPRRDAGRARRRTASSSSARSAVKPLRAGTLCGAEGNRTPDLLTASQALSQLSYSPGKGTPSLPPPHRSASIFDRCAHLSSTRCRERARIVRSLPARAGRRRRRRSPSRRARGRRHASARLPRSSHRARPAR